MGNPAGVRRDFDALEQRRLEAVRLLKRGLSQAEVARQLGVHRQSVYRWAKTVSESGKAALKKAGRAGRRPLLDARDLEKLERILKRGPDALGYDTKLWSSWLVAEVIEETFGVEYHPGHVWRILRQMGWSVQRPTGRAIERDEEAIRRWKRRRWPIVKKTLQNKDARSSSSTRAD
jgi:transposase